MFAGKGGAQLRGNLVIIETFDGGDIGAIACHRISDAGARRYAIDQDGAGTADAMFAAEMRAGEIERVAHHVGETRAWLDVLFTARVLTVSSTEFMPRPPQQRGAEW